MRRQLDWREATIRAGLAALGYSSRNVATGIGRMRVLECEGRGPLPTIVLLHGLGSRAADYLPLAQRLRTHARRVVAPDLAGHGASDTPLVLDVNAWFESVAEALEPCLDEPAVIFGNSLGGFAAIRFALARPKLVRGLFLASPAGAPLAPEERDQLLATLRVETHEAALEFLGLVLNGRPPGAFRHVLAWGLQRRFSAVRSLIDGTPRVHALTAEELAQVSAPVRLVWGRGERLFPASQLAFFRKHLSHAIFEEPFGLGHSPQLDDAGRVARDILTFAATT